MWFPRPFTRATAILGPHHAAREKVLRAWCIALEPPPCQPHIPAHQMGVRELGRAIESALHTCDAYLHTRAYIGGSAVSWVQGSTQQVRKPDDVDVAFFVTRRPHASLESLRANVTDALRALYADKLGLDTQAKAALRFHAPILESHNADDAILSLRLGTAAQHIDVRFVFTDTRFRLYDYVCNALCCNLYDSSIWSVMPGADVEQVLADIRQSIYRADHTLSDGSITRAWKMNRRGLAPADPAQERRLWDQLARSISTGGAHDTKGPGLRLAELLARETDARRHGASPERSKAALALFANARLGLAAAGMRTHQSLVDQQLKQRITSLLTQLALSPQTRALMAVLHEDGGPERLAQWCAIFARTPDAFIWPEAADDVVIERIGAGPRVLLRLFVPELEAFLILHVPERPVPWVAPKTQLAAVGSAPAHDARQLAAHTCGEARLACWAPNPDLHNAQTRRGWADAWLAQYDAVAPQELSSQAGGVLAALALSPHAALHARHIAALREALGAFAADQALQVHLCGRIEAACQTLTQDNDAAHALASDAVRKQAWASLALAAPCVRRRDRLASPLAQVRAFEAAAAQILHTLAHAPHRRAIDMPAVATLLAHAALPQGHNTPEALRTWVLWRAHVSARATGGIEALQAPLRPVLRVARRAVAQGHTAWLTPLLAHALAQADGVALCLHVDALVACPAPAMPTAVARRILTSLPAAGGHPHHVAAARTALAALAPHRIALTQTAQQGAWLKRLLASAATRVAVVEALTQASCVIDAKLAEKLMTPLLIFPALKHTAAHLLATPAARDVFALHAAAHLWASADRAMLVTRWRHIYLLLNTAQAASGPHAAMLAQRFVAHYALVSLPEAAREEPLNFLETVITTGLADSSDTPDPALGIGHARLMLLSRDRAALALPALHTHASAALAHATLAPAFVRCMLALLAQLAPSDPNAPELCIGLAGCITQVPRIASTARDEAAEMAVQLILFCSAAYAPARAGQMLVHVHEQWRLSHVGQLINHRVSQRAEQEQTQAWMMTLAANVAPEDMRAGVCLPLLDARLEAMVEHYTRVSPAGDAAVFEACLQALSPALRVREKALAGHPLDRLNLLLVPFFRQAPNPLALRQWMFSDPQSRDVRARLWASMWLCWCGAAANSAEARIRARLVYEHLRLDLSACTTDAAPCPDALDIAVPLVALTTHDVSDGQFCMERWTQLVALCCVKTPKLWWLEALCEASPRHRARLLAHVVDVLTEQLQAACAQQTRGNSPEADRKTALTLLYIVAHHVDALPETHLVDAAQAALDAAGPHLTSDPASWHVLVRRVQDWAPEYGGRLDPYLHRIEQGRRPATGPSVRQHVSLNALRAENMAAWLRMTTPDKFIYAFEAVAAMEASWAWQPASVVYSWRTAVGAIVRRPHGVAAMKAYLTETVITPDTQAQPAWALGCLFDALWDAGALDTEVVTLLLKQMARSQCQPQTHAPLSSLTQRLCRSVGDFQMHLGPDALQAARAWTQAVRLHPSLHDAAQQLVEAIEAGTRL